MEFPVVLRASIAAKIRSAIQTHFAHWEVLPDYDFEATFQQFMVEVLSAPGRLEFDLAAIKFMASLNNGHTSFWDSWLLRTHATSIGLIVRRLTDGWYVIASAHAGIGPGVKIVSIDHQSIDAFFADKKRYVEGSSERARESVLFFRSYLFPKSFKIGLDDGRSHLIVRGAAGIQIPQAPTNQWFQKGRTLYIRIPSFSDPAYEAQAEAFIRALPPTGRLIIDLRDNGGGSTPLKLVEALMPHRFRFWSYAIRDSGSVSTAASERTNMSKQEARWYAAWPNAFSGALAILINRGTFSAAEDFSQPFKDSDRARLIGEYTGGSSGQPFFEDLGDGLGFRVGAKRQYLPDGGSFEGVGIAPDDAVDVTGEDLRQGRDAALDHALDWLDAH